MTSSYHWVETIFVQLSERITEVINAFHRKTSDLLLTFSCNFSKAPVELLTVST